MIKVAIVHDSLNEFGGAEKVLKELLEIFPKAEIFTSSYTEEVVEKNFSELKTNQLNTSWFQYFPKKSTTILQFFSPLIWRLSRLKKFDLVVTNSAYGLSPIATLNCVNALHYVLSLPKNLFGLEKQSSLQQKLPFSFQKNLYIKSLKASGKVISDSQYTKDLLKKTIDVDSSVIYPPVEIPRSSFVKKRGKYFLIVSRIDETKNLKIVISAFKQLNLPLKIIGTAQNHNYFQKLQSLSGKKTEFLGFINEKEKGRLYSEAIALISCKKDEDFGIAPVEAMAYGVPVIAFYGGGLKETVFDGQTGCFFYNSSPEALIQAINRFQRLNINSKVLYRHAQQFSSEKFRKNIINYIKSNFNSSFK